MAFEFHRCDLNPISEIIGKIKENFHITHIHCNSVCGLSSDGFPVALEMIFVNKSIMTDVELFDGEIYRHEMDAPNREDHEDFLICFR